MSPFCARAAFRRFHIVRCRSNPHLLTVIGFLEFPNSQVMAFRESVERFLKHTYCLYRSQHQTYKGAPSVGIQIPLFAKKFRRS